MNKRLTSLGQGLLAATVLAGVACQGEEYTASDDDIQLGVALEELGVEVVDCTQALVDTDFVALTKTLTIAVPTGDDAVVSVVGGKLKVNGWQCKNSANTELTTTNVNKININVAGTSKIVFDLLPGTFGNVFGNTGGIVVTDTTSGGGGLSVGVRGTAGANPFKMAQEGSAAAGPYYLELSGNTQADVKIVGDPDAVSFALGDGADTFSAQGEVLTVSHLTGTGPTTSVRAGEPISVFGGLGIDTLKGGLGDDTLDGGPGNDIFLTSADAVDDGGDTYVGGAGTDLVDYSGRTAALNVSIAPTYVRGWVEGVNIFDFTVDATETLIYNDGSGAATITFPGSATVGQAAILAYLNGASGFNGAAAASVNDRGELVVIKSGAAGQMNITGGTAGLFAGATPTNNGVSQLATDPDDGLSGELDDVRGDVENVTGGTVADTILGSIVSNTINGGGGADDISGGIAGSDCALDVDVLNGGDGDDMFRLGSAANCGDAVDGGAGRDTANYELRSGALTIDIDGVADDGESADVDNVRTTIEVVMGGEGGDTITGGALDEELHGGIGVDTLTGGAGADTLVGGTGNDTLNGGAGNDTFNEKDIDDAPYIKVFTAFGNADVINGGADFDKCDYGRAAATAMAFTLCTSATLTGAGCATSNDDAVAGELDDLTNCDHLIGGGGVDTVTGSDGDDTVEGGPGADVMNAGAGNDTLFGDTGDDTLNGEDGEDSIDGGPATVANTINGGDGDDVCVEGTATACEL